MEKKVIRSGIFVKVIGIITTAIFSLVSLFLAITGNIMASICFLPFVALGILLLLAYKKERILVEEDRLIFFHLFKQPKQVKYSDIRCLLLVPLGSRIQMVLVDRQYNRLVTLDYALADLEILFEALLENDIPSVDLGEMTEKGENVSQYIKCHGEKPLQIHCRRNKNDGDPVRRKRALSHCRRKEIFKSSRLDPDISECSGLPGRW